MEREFFIKNREKIICDLEDGSVLVIFAGKVPDMNTDSRCIFNINRNFYYLTGSEVEGQVLVITKKENKTETFLYIDDVDERFQKWTGRQMTVTQAKETTGIDNIKFLSTFKVDFHKILRDFSIEKLYLDLDRLSFDHTCTMAQKMANEVRQKYQNIVIKDIFKSLSRLRAIKSEEEIDSLKKAIEITKEGIYSMMKASKANMYEYELEAEFDYVLKKNGIRKQSFPAIIAAGDNGCILHYGENTDIMLDGELVCCDLGATYNNYCADITRTFPVNGKFTERQKQIYKIVLNANKLAIKSAKPGITELDLKEISVNYMVDELKKIGLIKEYDEIFKYFPHGLGHPLGLKAHDACERNVKLQPGNVCTIEPGLYIDEEKIGIRIEDDILITKDGCINLSESIIKEIEDIEKFMSK